VSALISVSGVGKTFRIPSVRRDTIREHVLDFLRPRPYEALHVLDDVSFEVRSGETLGIMGHNGSGKSTLLKILAGIYLPDRGHLEVGAPVTPLLELGIGWNPELDAIDNTLLIGTAMGLSLAEARGSMEEILAFAELERFANLELKHYSSGMAARLAYSVAFSAVRDILLIDEIFAVGDAAFRLKCEERYLKLAASGHTVIVVSHDLRPILSFCNRALLLDRGRIAMEGSGLEVARAYLERMGDPRAATLSAAHPLDRG
jgi:ABC-type polysaccharide/polyol phosphate transport system ATPase subunit